MIHVSIELWPGGNPKNIRTLYTIEIANDMTGTQKLGNYFYKIYNRDSELLGKGVVTKFRRVAGALSLLGKVLKKEKI